MTLRDLLCRTGWISVYPNTWAQGWIPVTQIGGSSYLAALP